jgi:DNA topoisomerase-3
VAIPYQELEAAIEDIKGIKVKAALINLETNKTAFSVNSSYLIKAADYAKHHGKEVTVSVTTVKKVQKPEKLLNLTALQKIAYKEHGYSPDETLSIAQALYGKYKCLSYPRTPSRVMGDNNVDLFREKFHLFESKYRQWSQFSVPDLIDQSNKHIFNSAALEDHHALIPLAFLPENATVKERNVFEIVVKQFFITCMGDHIWNESKYHIKNGPYTYEGIAREILEIGWKAVNRKEKEPHGIQGTGEHLDPRTCHIKAITILDKKTSPPKLFQLDTLLAFMESPKATNNNENGGAGKLAGLGTPATRAEIIKTLFDRNYIVEEKKYLIPTKKGSWLIKKLKLDRQLAKLADVGETTEWERRLEKNPNEFENSIIEYVRTSIKPGNITQDFRKEPVGICPHCGNKVYEGKSSYFCSAWNSADKCKFTIWKTVSGANVTTGDVKLLLSGEKTGIKECTSKKTGKTFKAYFHLMENGEIEFIFQNVSQRQKNEKAKGMEYHELFE